MGKIPNSDVTLSSYQRGMAGWANAATLIPIWNLADINKRVIRNA